MDTRLGHTRFNVFQNYPFTVKQDKIPKKYQLIKTFKVSISTRNDWRLDFLIFPIQIWDFGSQTDRMPAFDARIYGPKEKENIPGRTSHGLSS